MLNDIIQTIESTLQANAQNSEISLEPAHQAFERFLQALEAGDVRTAAPDENGRYICDPRVKTLILYGFKLGHLVESQTSDFQFCDKHNLWPAQQNLVSRFVRIVPGGTTIRRGACVRSRVTIMPPAYVNIGAYIDEGSMIDSHALGGSCAQIGKNCHISAAAQIGGVLEPVGALPVIIEDNCFVGGNSGIYESTHLHRDVVIGAGTILTRSTPVFDLVKNEVIRAEDGILHIPAGAVVVPGSRAVRTDFAIENGLSAYAPLIIKYRDDKTDASLTLESLLR